jgi:hypothetical protein
LLSHSRLLPKSRTKISTASLSHITRFEDTPPSWCRPHTRPPHTHFSTHPTISLQPRKTPMTATLSMPGLHLKHKPRREKNKVNMDSLMVATKWLGRVKGYMLHISRHIGTRHPSAVVPPRSSSHPSPQPNRTAHGAKAASLTKSNLSILAPATSQRETPKPAFEDPVDIVTGSTRHSSSSLSQGDTYWFSCCSSVRFDDPAHVLYTIELLMQSFSMTIYRHTTQTDGRRDEHHSTPTP